MTLFLEIPLAVSLSICGLRFLCVRRAVREPPRFEGAEPFAPPISVLKPLKGVDDRLADNLATFCRQEYPDYEIVFCLQSSSDPALRVVRRIRERFPGRDISVVVGDVRDGLNPKVNNLIPGYAAARHEFLLVSDSNVAVGPGYLREAVSHFRDPDVGLVNHLVRGVGGRSLGARLENGHLNTHILGSIALLDRVFGRPCVVGKSMLMRRRDLDALGGFPAVKDFLAEDYTLGAMFRRSGRKVVISAAVVDNVNVYRGVREFLSRHARWNRMRFSVAGPAYLAEAASNPLPIALLQVLWAGGSAESLSVAAVALAVKSGLDAATEGLLGTEGGVRTILLGPLRDLLAVGICFSAFFSRTVTWRGRTLRIRRGSRLVPLDGPAAGRIASPGAPVPATSGIGAENGSPAGAVA